MSIKYLLLFSIIFILTSCTQTNKAVTSPSTVPQTSITQQTAPIPTPFSEMTIPSLRSRTYSSSLSELQQTSQNNSFTTHLTSYSSDNLKINALITKPQGQMPNTGWPAIVFVHGYIPPTLYRTTERYVDYVNFLARNGFVVFKIDLRGHGSSEGEATGAYYSADYVVDTLNAYAALQSTDFVDPNGIGLWGHSMAGNVLLRAATAKLDIPAVVIWGGAVYTYTDMQSFGIDDNSYRPPASTAPSRQRREALFQTHGNFDSQHPFWKQIPPTNYLDGLKTAVHLHHAQDDNVVSIEYSRNLQQILQSQNIENELYTYSSGGHNLTGSSFSTAMQRTVDLFKAKLIKK